MSSKIVGFAHPGAEAKKLFSKNPQSEFNKFISNIVFLATLEPRISGLDQQLLRKARADDNADAEFLARRVLRCIVREGRAPELALGSRISLWRSAAKGTTFGELAARSNFKPRIRAFLARHLAAVECRIDYSADFAMDLPALHAWRRQFAVAVGGEVLESPQDTWMRVALELGVSDVSENSLHMVMRLFDIFSRRAAVAHPRFARAACIQGAEARTQTRVFPVVPMEEAKRWLGTRAGWTLLIPEDRVHATPPDRWDDIAASQIQTGYPGVVFGKPELPAAEGKLVLAIDLNAASYAGDLQRLKRDVKTLVYGLSNSSAAVNLGAHGLHDALQTEPFGFGADFFEALAFAAWEASCEVAQSRPGRSLRTRLPSGLSQDWIGLHQMRERVGGVAHSAIVGSPLIEATATVMGASPWRVSRHETSVECEVGALRLAPTPQNTDPALAAAGQRFFSRTPTEPCIVRDATPQTLWKFVRRTWEHGAVAAACQFICL